MPITASGYAIKKDLWFDTKENGEAKSGDKATQHAERIAHKAMLKSSKKLADPFLIQLNAFPCTECCEYFKKGQGLIIARVLQDHGSYSMEHKKKIGAVAVPCWVLLTGGDYHFFQDYDALVASVTAAIAAKTIEKSKKLPLKAPADEIMEK